MREKKYANILDDYPEEVVEEIKEETQEKLSMTRELKFKELQDKIDDEDKVVVEETTEEIKIEEVKTFDEDILEDVNVTAELSKKELKARTKEEKKARKAMQEDLYLTSSFKPLKSRFRLKKVFKVIFSLLLFIGIIGAVGYFVVWPLYNKYMDSKPKAIFEHAIDYVADNVYNTIDSNWSYTDDFSYINMGFMVEAEDEMDYINTYYGFSLGFNDDEAEEYIYIKDPNTNEEYGISLLIDDGMAYYKSTHSDTYYGMESDTDIQFGLYDSEGEEINLTKEDFKYFIDKERSTLKELLLDEYIETEKDEIEIDGKTTEVTKNSYTLEGEEYNEVIKKYRDILIKDDKYLEIFAKIDGSTVDDVKDEYFGEIEEADEDYVLSINIYTVKGNEVVGFDIEENGFRVLYLYFNEGGFDFHLNLTTDEDCLEGRDCVIENMMVIDLVGTYKDDYTEVVVEYNEDEVATLDIRDLSFEKIDLDYDIDYMDFEVDGTLVLDLNSDSHEYKADISLDYDDVEMSVIFELEFDDEFKMNEINPENVKEYSDELVSNDLESLYLILDEKGLVEEFDMWLNSLLSAVPDSVPLDDFGITM